MAHETNQQQRAPHQQQRRWKAAKGLEARLYSALAIGTVLSAAWMLWMPLPSHHHHLHHHNRYNYGAPLLFHRRNLKLLPQSSFSISSSSKISDPHSISKITTSAVTSNKNNSNHHQQQAPSHQLPPCRVLVENKPDYHYELMESVIMRYPLNWGELSCSTSTTTATSTTFRRHQNYNNNNNNMTVVVRFDVAHAATGWYNGELDGWLKYYQTYLQGRRRRRPTDGVIVEFGPARPFTQYSLEQKNTLYHAVIGVSCGMTPPLNYLNEHPNRFCVLHSRCIRTSNNHDDDDNNNDSDLSQRQEQQQRHQQRRNSRIRTSIPCNATNLMKRSCWPNPQHACFFNPIDLPTKFGADDDVDDDKKSNKSHTKNCGNGNSIYSRRINICTIGALKNHKRLIDGLNHLTLVNVSNDVQVSIHGRANKTSLGKDQGKLLLQQYLHQTALTTDVVRIIDERDFLKFEKSVSQCNLLLPLLEPPSAIKYGYLGGGGKLSGCLPQAMAYRIPMVMHAELQAIYGPYLTAPVLTYNNSLSEFAPALDRMLWHLKHAAPVPRGKRRIQQQQQQQQKC